GERSSWVTEALVQVPERSGWPKPLRGVFQASAALAAPAAARASAAAAAAAFQARVGPYSVERVMLSPLVLAGGRSCRAALCALRRKGPSARKLDGRARTGETGPSPRGASDAQTDRTRRRDGGPAGRGLQHRLRRRQGRRGRRPRGRQDGGRRQALANATL